MDFTISFKKNEPSKTLTVHQINLLYDAFPDFRFFDDDDDDDDYDDDDDDDDDGPELCHDALPDVSGQSSY